MYLAVIRLPFTMTQPTMPEVRPLFRTPSHSGRYHQRASSLLLCAGWHATMITDGIPQRVWIRLRLPPYRTLHFQWIACSRLFEISSCEHFISRKHFIEKCWYLVEALEFREVKWTGHIRKWCKWKSCWSLLKKIVKPCFDRENMMPNVNDKRKRVLHHARLFSNSLKILYAHLVL